MEAITATYEEHDDDWSVTVVGLGKKLTERAPGIIAARDQAEQLVDSLKPEQGETAVVHLLHGSALEFTTAYMTARLGRATSTARLGRTGERSADAGPDDETGLTEDTGNTDTENADDSAQELAK